LGDPLYGDPDLDRRAGVTLTRQALHSRRLELKHPFTGERLEIEAPLPEDLREVLAATGLGEVPAS
jgi:23S rRNA pseudouridine1911/1915/1917 synthase